MTPSTSTPVYDIVIIGGGFFGLSLAQFFYRERGVRSILVLEKERDVMQRASYRNQARVHTGYHYPRSILTALRSRVNMPRFLHDYEACITKDFESYYAVGTALSKVSAAQFRLFCERIGAEIEDASSEITALFDPTMIEAVFRTKEYVFDAVKLKSMLLQDLSRTPIELRTGVKALQVFSIPDGGVGIKAQAETGTSFQVNAEHVYNCSYASLNELNLASDLPVIPLKHELTEIVLTELSPAFKTFGVTVMDGPFFSLLPFPSSGGLHSLTHVRYTPHASWNEASDPSADRHLDLLEARSGYPAMIADVRRHIPRLPEAVFRRSLWEVKTILPKSEGDDSRPILFRRDHGFPGYHCILGGKIDNIYDVFEEVATISAPSSVPVYA